MFQDDHSGFHGLISCPRNLDLTLLFLVIYRLYSKYCKSDAVQLFQLIWEDHWWIQAI